MDKGRLIPTAKKLTLFWRFCVSRQKRFAFRLRRGRRLYPEARVRYSRGRAFGARAFPAPFGLGARLGGRSRGPYTSDQ